MSDKTPLNPVAEAQARIALRYSRARPARQPQAIGPVVEAIVRRAAPAKGPAIGRLKARWSEIVGEGIARYCRPEKLTSTRTGRTLILRVVPSAAPVIQHQAEVIRQRVSVAAGGSITGLRLVQGPLAGTPKPPPPLRKVGPAERAALERQASGIADPGLRAALVALGEAVLAGTGDSR